MRLHPAKMGEESKKKKDETGRPGRRKTNNEARNGLSSGMSWMQKAKQQHKCGSIFSCLHENQENFPHGKIDVKVK